MSSVIGTLFSIAFFSILICVFCRCINACCRKKRLQHGTVISTHAAGTINGQNVHVISQTTPTHHLPPNSQPNFYPPAGYQTNQYQANQYPANQYPPNQYPPATYPDQHPIPPPPYSAAPIYPNPYLKTDNQQQQASNDKPTNQTFQPSAPEF